MTDCNLKTDEVIVELKASDLTFKSTITSGSATCKPRSFASLQLRAKSALKALLKNPCAHYLLLTIPDCVDNAYASKQLVEESHGLSINLTSLKKSDFKQALLESSSNDQVFVIAGDELLAHPKRMALIQESLLRKENFKVLIGANAQDLSDLMIIWPQLKYALHADYVVEQSYSPALLGSLVAFLREQKGFKDLSAEALILLAQRCAREAEDRQTMLLDERNLILLLAEASQMSLGAEISARELLKALAAFDFRQNYIATALMREHRAHQIYMSTSGSCIGQINGLSVIETTGSCYEYGEPVRITATLKAGGDGEITDIERKAELAGQIHAKAMMIINGFLNFEFGAVLPLPASASLAFEQSYSEIDGDSASLSGLCAVLSAYSDLPLRQDLAVTGAVDQFGNVQPVGGINQKIEGFYKICSLQGFTNTQGVVIPYSCINQLVLRPQLIRAISSGKFHIYAVKHVKAAFSLFTGVKWGDPETENSVVAKIIERLDGISNHGEERPWWHFWQ